MALIHSEVSEALEWHRSSPAPAMEMQDIQYSSTPEGKKPEGVASELADVIIRICDNAKGRGIPLERAIREKLEYNKFRSYRHGGKNY